MSAAEDGAWSPAILPPTIGDYRVLRVLGEGCHGRCYLARPPGRLGLGDRVVVLKVLADRISELTFELGVRELRAVAAARSRYVVPVYDAILEDGFAYAMEFYPLGSLADPGRELLRIEVLAALEQAARAAHDLHESGVAHGGIRPGNVLLAEDGLTVGGRLADPGLARVLTPGAAVPASGRASALEFTDPDLLSGARPSRASEVWALGATIHRALSGTSLFGPLPDAQPLRVIRELLSARPHIQGGLAQGEAALVRDCIAPGADRIATAAEVADRLAELSSLP